MAKTKKKDSFGLASLVLGVLGIILFLTPGVGIICGILAIHFSGKQQKIGMTEQAKFGKITGIIGLIISSLYLILVLFFFGFF